jgi:predicted GNAT family N-acyltransferase
MAQLYFCPMLRIEVLPWEKARALAVPIRFSVFVEEQGVPREMELDQADAHSLHAVAFDDAEPVGTGRLLPDGHIGRMAVLKAWRGRGIGGQILHRLMQQARERGDREVVLSAQVDASAFYRAHGFAEEGPEYFEAGIRHRDMRRRL